MHVSINMRFHCVADICPSRPAQSAQDETAGSTRSSDVKRKHICDYPGCEKSFTTSGHLARHARTHTGEKKFQCTFAGCQSRFSRHDNMLQQYVDSV